MIGLRRNAGSGRRINDCEVCARMDTSHRFFFNVGFIGTLVATTMLIGFVLVKLFQL